MKCPFRHFLVLVAVSVCISPVLLKSASSQVQAESARTDTTLQLAGQESSLRWYTMFANLPHDWVRFARITFRPSNIPFFIGMAALTTALIATDDETWHLSDRFYNHSVTVRNGSDFFEYLGDGRPQFGLAGGFALYGLVFGNQRALRTGSQLVEGILSCGAVVQTLKHITGRQSPYVSTIPGGVWDFFPNQIDYHKHVPSYDAYPSGHIATAMATVTVVAENYPEWKWVRPVGYVAVGLIGVSMANTGIHWYSDFPLGIALGYVFGMIVSHPEGLPVETTPENKAPLVSFSPVFNAGGTGLGVAISF
jgi:membrane-associated phospholipid phosphatase